MVGQSEVRIHHFSIKLINLNILTFYLFNSASAIFKLWFHKYSISISRKQKKQLGTNESQSVAQTIRTNKNSKLDNLRQSS